jgi:hypothetical protein
MEAGTAQLVRRTGHALEDQGIKINSLQTGSEVDQASYQEAFGALAVRGTEDDTENSPPTVRGNITNDRLKGEAAV